MRLGLLGPVYSDIVLPCSLLAMDHFQDLANVPRQLGTILIKIPKGGLCLFSDEYIFLITELAHEGEVLACGVEA